jgi:hypothetical protein
VSSILLYQRAEDRLKYSGVAELRDERGEMVGRGIDDEIDGYTPFPLKDYRLAFSLCPLRSLRLCG